MHIPSNGQPTTCVTSTSNGGFILEEKNVHPEDVVLNHPSYKAGHIRWNSERRGVSRSIAAFEAELLIWKFEKPMKKADGTWMTPKVLWRRNDGTYRRATYQDVIRNVGSQRSSPPNLIMDIEKAVEYTLQESSGTPLNTTQGNEIQPFGRIDTDLDLDAYWDRSADDDEEEEEDDDDDDDDTVVLQKSERRGADSSIGQGTADATAETLWTFLRQKQQLLEQPGQQEWQEPAQIPPFHFGCIPDDTISDVTVDTTLSSTNEKNTLQSRIDIKRKTDQRDDWMKPKRGIECQPDPYAHDGGLQSPQRSGLQPYRDIKCQPVQEENEAEPEPQKRDEDPSIGDIKRHPDPHDDEDDVGYKPPQRPEPSVGGDASVGGARPDSNMKNRGGQRPQPQGTVGNGQEFLVVRPNLYGSLQTGAFKPLKPARSISPVPGHTSPKDTIPNWSICGQTQPPVDAHILTANSESNQNLMQCEAGIGSRRGGICECNHNQAAFPTGMHDNLQGHGNHRQLPIPSVGNDGSHCVALTPPFRTLSAPARFEYGGTQSHLGTKRPTPSVSLNGVESTASYGRTFSTSNRTLSAPPSLECNGIQSGLRVAYDGSLRLNGVELNSSYGVTSSHLAMATSAPGFERNGIQSSQSDRSVTDDESLRHNDIESSTSYGRACAPGRTLSAPPSLEHYGAESSLNIERSTRRVEYNENTGLNGVELNSSYGRTGAPGRTLSAPPSLLYNVIPPNNRDEKPSLQKEAKLRGQTLGTERMLQVNEEPARLQLQLLENSLHTRSDHFGVDNSRHREQVGNACSMAHSVEVSSHASSGSCQSEVDEAYKVTPTCSSGTTNSINAKEKDRLIALYLQSLDVSSVGNAGKNRMPTASVSSRVDSPVSRSSRTLIMDSSLGGSSSLISVGGVPTRPPEQAVHSDSGVLTGQHQQLRENASLVNRRGRFFPGFNLLSSCLPRAARGRSKARRRKRQKSLGGRRSKGRSSNCLCKQTRSHSKGKGSKGRSNGCKARTNKAKRRSRSGGIQKKSPGQSCEGLAERQSMVTKNNLRKVSNSSDDQRCDGALVPLPGAVVIAGRNNGYRY